MNSLHLRAAFVPSTLNEEDRTMELIFGTETPYLRSGWNGNYNEVLSFAPEHVRMDRLNSGAAPLLDNHDRWGGAKTVLGVVEKAWIEGAEGRAIVRFSKREEVEEVFQDVKDGILKGISVGYRVYTYEEKSNTASPVGASTANEVKTYTAIDWEPMEISIAPVPADYNSVIRSEEDANQVTIIKHNPSNTTEMKREQIIAALTRSGISVDPNCTDEELLAQLERALKPDTPTPPAAAPAASAEEQARAATAAERKRVSDIQELCRKAGTDSEQVEKYIKDGTSAENVRSEVLQRFLDSDPNKGASANARVTRDEADVTRERMVNAMALRSGEVAPKHFTADQIEGAREFRGMRLVDVAKDCLERAGESVRGMDEMHIVGRAITSSTSDFPILLEGTNRRVLLANYEAIADTWRRFCSVGSVSDFRENKRLRLGSFSSLDVVNENAEYKTKQINDASFEKISIATKGNIINVSRKMIINDDLSGFTRLAAMLGRAAARSIEKDVYALLALNSGLGPNMVDGNPLFHASHGNIGTGAALSVASIDADLVLMASQMDPDGNDYLDIRPEILLISKSLESAAKVINSSTYNPDVNNKLQAPNPVSSAFSDIVGTPRLTGTRRYMFANPSVEPVLEVAFLNGVQTPFLETEEGFTVDGMKWKIRLDYGVGAVGFKGAFTNAGVAS